MVSRIADLAQEARRLRAAWDRPWGLNRTTPTEDRLCDFINRCMKVLDELADIEPMPEEDIRVELYDPHPQTGMHVGVTHLGVRVTLTSRGLTAESHTERSQIANKQRALEKLWALMQKDTP